MLHVEGLLQKVSIKKLQILMKLLSFFFCKPAEAIKNKKILDEMMYMIYMHDVYTLLTTCTVVILLLTSTRLCLALIQASIEARL